MTLNEITEKLNSLENTPSLKDVKGAKELPNVLRQGEEILAAVTGVMLHRGILIATNERMIFVGTCMPFSAVRIEEISYNDTSSLQCQSGMLAAKVIASTTTEKFEMDMIDKKQARRFVELIQPLTVAGTLPPSTKQGDEDAMEKKLEQLERLGKLKEQGILTEDEFNTQKASILN